MPLDLVGKLHRTVYITGCPEDSQEDLMQMLLKRCGAVEAWDLADGRLIVVFQSMNSVSNALSFDGLSFVDLTKRISVWRATDRPPAEATQQLAIQGGNGGPSSSTETAEGASAAAETEEDQQRRTLRKERRAALQEMLNRDTKTYDVSSPEGRQSKLNELCRRQLQALCVLTAAALKDATAELEVKQTNLERLRDLIRTKEGPGAGEAGEEPPRSKPRMDAS